MIFSKVSAGVFAIFYFSSVHRKYYCDICGFCLDATWSLHETIHFMRVHCRPVVTARNYNQVFNL